MSVPLQARSCALKVVTTIGKLAWLWLPSPGPVGFVVAPYRKVLRTNPKRFGPIGFGPRLA
jgi:hypothetical protein